MDKFPQGGSSSSSSSNTAIPSSSSSSTCWDLLGMGMGVGMAMAIEHEEYSHHNHHSQINFHDPYHHPYAQQQHQDYHHHHPSPFATTSSPIWPITTSLYPHSSSPSSSAVSASLFKPSSTSTSFFQFSTTSPARAAAPHQQPQPLGLVPVVLRSVDEEDNHHKSERNKQHQQEEVPTEEAEDEEEEEELGAMKEMMYKIAAMQPVDIDPASIRKPKRRNVRISDDPQSVAARHRRERISEKIRILQRLVPGGTKLDTASMLEEAIRYVKFLKRQIRQLQDSPTSPPPLAGRSGHNLGHQPVEVTNTPSAQQPLGDGGGVGPFQSDVSPSSDLGVKMEGSSVAGILMVNSSNTTNIAANTTTSDSVNVGPSFTFN